MFDNRVHRIGSLTADAMYCPIGQDKNDYILYTRRRTALNGLVLRINKSTFTKEAAVSEDTGCCEI